MENCDVKSFGYIFPFFENVMNVFDTHSIYTCHSARRSRMKRLWTGKETIDGGAENLPLMCELNEDVTGFDLYTALCVDIDVYVCR